MSRLSTLHAIVAAKVRKDAMAKVVTVILADGDKVVSHHADFNSANVALCAALDVYYGDGSVEKPPHRFDLIPLSTAPAVGTAYDKRDRIWIP